MNTLFKILMFVGVAILLYNAIARPEDALLFSTAGVLLVMISGSVLVLSNKQNESK